MIELWRTDIHGNDFFMRNFVTREVAEEVRQEYENRGHKQTYWLKEPLMKYSVSFRTLRKGQEAKVAGAILPSSDWVIEDVDPIAAGIQVLKLLQVPDDVGAEHTRVDLQDLKSIVLTIDRTST